MPTKNVALADDVVTEPGSVHASGLYEGEWSVTLVTEQTYDHLTVEGSPVIHEVTADFHFQGNNLNTGADYAEDVSVTLSASPTILTYGGGPVLVDGDAAQDAHGNTVRIDSSRHLKTE